MSADAELVTLFKRELELCKVHAGETVAVLTQNGERTAYAEGFLQAAQQLGATAFQLNLLKRSGAGDAAFVGRTALAGNRPAVEALKGADIVIDLVFLLFSPEQLEIMRAGTRILTAIEDIEVMRRRFPTDSLRARVECGEALLAKAKTLHITSSAGTDVTYRLGKYPVVTEYGFTDLRGRWDIWPSGFLFTGAYDDGVDGTVVIDTGDILFPFRRYVESPIRLTIEKGFIRAIDGTGIDATLVRNYIDSFNDPRAFAVSHIGWGLDEKANWHHFAVANQSVGSDVLAFYGNVLFSTGPNGELGGTNDTPCHFDIPMRNCTLTLDGDVIVKGGRIVHPGMTIPGLPAAAE